MTSSTLGPAPGSAEKERVLSVVFRAGGERYLIQARDVFKVAEVPAVNRIPRLPPAILGITQHRGKVLTVIDLVQLLFGERGPGLLPSGQSRLVILDRGSRNAGLLVDAIEEIAPVRLGAARQGPSPALSVIQHRGRPIHGVRSDVLMEMILGLAPRDAAPA